MLDDEGRPTLVWAERDRPLVKLHYVFNMEQVEGLQLRSPRRRGRSGKGTSGPRR